MIKKKNAQHSVILVLSVYKKKKSMKVVTELSMNKQHT